MSLLLMIWRKVKVNDEEKEAACTDGTPSDDMEEGVSDEKDDKNATIDEEK